MRKRFWVPAAVAVALVAGVLAGFRPLVASLVADRARQYGATVQVDGIAPSWRGVVLTGVRARLEGVSGVEVGLDRVVVGWSERRVLEASGGWVDATGAFPELARAATAWRAKYLARGEGSGGAGTREFPVFSARWRNQQVLPTRSVAATGVELGRDAQGWRVSVSTLEAELEGATARAKGAAVAVARAGDGYVVRELRSVELSLDLPLQAVAVLQERADPAEVEPAEEPRPPSTAASVGAGAPGVPPAAVAGGDPTTHPHVERVRRLRASLTSIARQLDSFLAPEAAVELTGLSARVELGGDALQLGPGVGVVRRDAGALVVELLRPEDVAADRQQLGVAPEGGEAPVGVRFSVRIPLHDPGALVAELRGGPIWLSSLGMKEGQLGLRALGTSSLWADARVVLPESGTRVEVDGSGRLEDLAVDSRKLSAEAVTGLDVAWRGKGSASLDGRTVELAEVELEVGGARLLLSGKYERIVGGHRLDVRYRVPLLTCQQALDAIPAAMKPDLEGMRVSGSLSFEGKAKLDTTQLDKTFDVDFTGTNSCRMVEVPARLAVARFRAPFEKLVYTASGTLRNQTFGPNTPTWVPYQGIARYMETAALTCEDGAFFRHRGFHKEAIVNSIRENIREGRFVRGASTISMQLAKNLYLSRDKSISRKLQEAVLTSYLEQQLTKREMMELYLNVVEFGPDVYGIGPAARHYFNSNPARLSLGQALYLASILRNPKKQYFGAGGAVIPSHMQYLRRLMKIVHKIKRISDEELEHGLRETVLFGSPAPMVAPPEPADEPAEASGGEVQPAEPPKGAWLGN